MTDGREATRRALFDEYARTGSTEARNAIVESFAPLAEYFAARYRDRGVASDDLRQVAQLALVKAADRFDPTLGVKFSTFAGRTMDGELKRYFRDRTWPMRVPRSLKELSADVRRAVEVLTRENDRSPTVAELADYLKIDHDLVVEALDVQDAYRPTSLDRPAGEDESTSLVDLLGTTDPDLAHRLDAMTVSDLLATLDERERRIVELRFYEGLSQSEIAERVGLSQMHVSRLLRASFQQLRAHLT